MSGWYEVHQCSWRHRPFGHTVRMPVYRSAGLRLHYVERGDGPGAPLVLLHGLFTSYRLYDRLAAKVTDRRVIRPDLRGHGGSDRPTEPDQYRWRIMADDVAALLDHLGIERAVVGGLSLGANIAVSVAEHHGDRLDGLIVEMPVLTRGRVAAERLFPRLAQAARVLDPLLAGPTGVARRLPHVLPGELGVLHDVFGTHFRALIAMEEGLLESGEPFPAHDGEALSLIKVPTLVIAHRHDGLHALDDAGDMVAGLPNGELVEMRTIADLRLRPRRYARIVNGFLARHHL